LKVGFHSPLPPVKSGVADYAAALLRELRRFGTVEVAAEKCDVALYHTGNNSLHREIYRRAIEQPGVAVLHDAVLQHFFLGSMTEEQYCEEFVYNYGEWARSEAKLLWDERAASALDQRYFARPMLKRLAERSNAVVVHNPGAAALVRVHAPLAQVVEIPHFFMGPEPVDASAVVQFRGRFRYLFGVFGYIRESKRLVPVLRTFERLRKMREGVGILIAGEIQSGDLLRAVEPLLSQQGVVRLEHMTEQEFALASQAVDCCVNLRYPSAGETSGIGVRLMGMGKPVIATAGPELDSLPDGTHLAITPGVREEAHLFEVMAMLAEFPEIGREIGRRAAQHISRYHSITAAAKQYWETLCEYRH
jgi:glycosyltransferase involved in cell wall biosynthesis